MGSAPECGDDELAYQTENEENIKDIVVTEISGKMSSNPSYDCDLQSSAQMKFGFYDEDGGFKFVDMNMSKSEEQFVKQAAEEWSEKLKSESSTKFGCTYAQWDHEGKPTKRLLGCVFA